MSILFSHFNIEICFLQAALKIKYNRYLRCRREVVISTKSKIYQFTPTLETLIIPMHNRGITFAVLHENEMKFFDALIYNIKSK